MDPDWYFEHVLAYAEPGMPVRRERGALATWRDWWSRQVAGAEPVRTAATQGFVLTTAQLAALGVSRSAARHAVRRGLWCVPAYGTVGVADIRTGAGDAGMISRRRHALVGAAAALKRPGHVVSGRTAAILHGLPTLAVPGQAELTDPVPDGLGSRGGAHLFGAGFADSATTSWFGTPVTTVARTLADLGRHDRRDALMAADAALREKATTLADLHVDIDAARGWPGVRQGRAVLGLASPLAESPLESLVRLAMHDDGFPEPELQYPIGGYRVDLALPGHRLIIEADGKDKYTGDELWREKRREHHLRALGWWVERVLWVDVLHNWPSTSARLWRALQRLPG